jgi:3-phosphoshikimate 1-carboxyvinyltransferase
MAERPPVAPDTFRVQPGGRLHGDLRVPGDKSISHRAVMLSAVADGVSRITGVLAGADVLATMAAFRAMGVQIDGPEDGKITVHGVGRDGLRAPAGPLDLQNSGTAMRLIAGLLAGQKFGATLIGDESLSGRPMKRIVEPLARMGAKIETAPGGTAPLVIIPSGPLAGIEYALPVASAQVKSAVLLAGLWAQGRSCVIEPAPTRDHTERMLRGFGYACEKQGARVCVEGGGRLAARNLDVPADLSSAAFFVVGASVAPGSELRLSHVGVNPTRTGILEILRRMGADIRQENAREVGGEPVADLIVRAAVLRSIEVPPEMVPSAIDEFPVLCVAAACAQGVTRITGAEELRHKESDRIAVMAEGLSSLGVPVREAPDGMEIEGGGGFAGGEINSRGDHRIAMSFSIAALAACAPILVRNCRNVATSFPGFHELAAQAGLGISSP